MIKKLKKLLTGGTRQYKVKGWIRSHTKMDKTDHIIQLLERIQRAKELIAETKQELKTLRHELEMIVNQE